MFLDDYLVQKGSHFEYNLDIYLYRYNLNIIFVYKYFFLIFICNFLEQKKILNIYSHYVHESISLSSLKIYYNYLKYFYIFTLEKKLLHYFFLLGDIKVNVRKYRYSFLVLIFFEMELLCYINHLIQRTKAFENCWPTRFTMQRKHHY